MRRLPSAAALLAVLAAWAPATAHAGAIVVLRGTDDAVAVETAQREDRLGFDAQRRFTHALRGFTADLTHGQAKALRDDPEVAAVVPDRPVHALGSVPTLAGETVPPGVRRVTGASATTSRDSATGAVAVLDSGVDLDHPDLHASPGKNCVGTAPPDDDAGHGTHVAGTIGARNDGAGVTGVAPGTKVIAVKVLRADGSGSLSTVLCGIDWVIRNASAEDIAVANFSLGAGGRQPSTCATDPTFHGAFCRLAGAGVTPVVAAGNDGVDFGGATPDVPAAYPEVLTVAATADTDGLPGGRGRTSPCGTPDDRYAAFSNFATAASDAEHLLAAPGDCILSTYPGGRWATLSGTSMAAPHVAALVALCEGEAGARGACAGLTTRQVIARMREAATPDAFAGAAGRLFGPLAALVGDAVPAAAAEPAPSAAPSAAGPSPDGAQAPPAGPAAPGDDPPPAAGAVEVPAAPPQPAAPAGAAPASAGPPSSARRAPRLTLARVRLAAFARHGLPVRLRCDGGCEGAVVRVRVAGGVARRLGLADTTIAMRTAAGPGTLALRPPARVARALRGARSLAVELVADVRSDGDGARAVLRLRLRLRR